MRSRTDTLFGVILSLGVTRMATPPPFHPGDDLIERRLARARRKRPRSLAWLVWASGGLFVVTLAVTLVVTVGRGGSTVSERSRVERQTAAGSVDGETRDDAGREVRRIAPASGALPPTWDSPTAGRQLDLRYLPAGVHLLVSFRPAALDSSTGREVNEGLGPAAEAMLKELEELCGVPADAIEHVLVGWIPSTDGQPPRTAASVRLDEPMARSALLEAWGNPTPTTEGVQRYYVAADGQRAFYVVDEQTFAVAPPELMREVVADAGQVQPQPQPRYVESLAPLSDADRHLCVIFDTEFLRDDADRLFPSAALPTVEAVLDFLGDDAPGGMFSVHLAPELFVELAVGGSTATSSRQLSAALDERLQQLPYDVLELVRGLRPRRGGRLVGRFPAMLKAVAVCTSLNLADRVVVLRVLLPERAGPNLAWAGPLVAEAAAGAGGQLAATPAPSARQLSLAERLKRPVTVGFRRTPLREAVGMISEESGIAFEFMMKDLESIGVTGNIPQEGEYQDVPPAEILDAILTKLELVYIANQDENKVYITSRKAAIERGQIPADE